MLTTVVAVISARCKNMTMILVLELVANLLVALSYILLGGFSGLYDLRRFLLFCNTKKKQAIRARGVLGWPV
ncbi:MAG: hypothetical protein SO147_00630 [Clostridia bacterium]|nr:hypothetical protein [Clostridia bacterium]